MKFGDVFIIGDNDINRSENSFSVEYSFTVCFFTKETSDYIHSIDVVWDNEKIIFYKEDVNRLNVVNDFRFKKLEDLKLEDRKIIIRELLGSTKCLRRDL